jgi:hypothetical protein
MPICKELLASDWGVSTIMVQTAESSKVHQNATNDSICDGAHYNYVLEYLEGEESMVVQI